MTLQDSDQFVVDRGNTPYSVEAQTLVAKLQDSDLMVVCRSGVPYKATGAEIKDSLGGGAIDPGVNDIVINPSVSGAGTEADPYILEAKTAAPFGAAIQSNETIQITGQAPDTPVVWVDSSVDAGTRFAQLSGLTTDATGAWSGTVQYLDSPDSTADTTYIGNLSIGRVYFQWTVTQKEIASTPPALTNVSLVESSPAEGARFTSQSFVASSQVTEGEPLSEKTFDAYVDGTLSKTVKFDEPLVSSAFDDSGKWNEVVLPEPNIILRAVTYGDNKFVAVGGAATESVLYSDDGISWTGVASPEPFANFYSVTYGNGKFVAVGSDHNFDGRSVMYSTDATSWTLATSAAVATGFQTWSSVTYGELPDGTKRFVAVSPDHSVRAMYSDDGITWVSATSSALVTTNEWTSVTYGDGKFVAVARKGSNKVMYSTDGITWSEGSGEGDGAWYSVAYGNNKFVAVAWALSDRVMYSDDGINWTPGLAPDQTQWESVTYGDGKFVAVSPNGTNRVMYSIDGINWSLVSLGIDSACNDVTYGNGKFVVVAVGGDKRIVWSTTGIGAVTALTFADPDTEGVAAGDTLTQTSNFTAPLESSTIDDSGKWNASTSAIAVANSEWKGVTWGIENSVVTFVAIADGGSSKTMYSTDGISWTAGGQLPETDFKGKGIAFQNKNGIQRFVAVGERSSVRVVYSDDFGRTWSNTNISTGINSANFTAITYGGTTGNEYFVAVADDVGASQNIVNSTNGINWGKETVTTARYTGVAYGDGKFVAVSIDGIIAYSTGTSANNWNSVNVEVFNLESVTYGNGRFVAVSSNAAMYSDDGISWTTVAGLEDNGWKSVTYADNKFLATGTQGSNRVMYSIDGISWKLVETQDPQSNWWSVTYADNKFVAVGEFGTSQAMWSTTGTGESTELTFPAATDMAALAVGNTLSQNDATGTVGSINGTTATLSSSSGTWVDSTFLNGPQVTTGDKTQASGTVSGVSTPDVLLSSSSGAWLDGTNVVGPQKTVVLQNTRLYCAFDTNGNITDLQNDPQDPPYTTTDANPGLTFTFPATFPSGQTPDDEMPEGTTFTVEVKAENIAGTSGPLSATVQPEPEPDPIKDALGGLTTLYTGNGTSQTITNGIDLANNGGLVWIKDRDSLNWHCLEDTLRGPEKVLFSNNNEAESLVENAVTSFNNDGFDLGSYYGENTDGAGFVAWTFAKAEKYFDVVKYVGTTEEPAGSAGSQTLSHSLGTKPGFMLVKKADGLGNWCVYHSSLGADNYMYLNLDLGNIAPSQKFWNNTEPTDTQFTVGWDSDVNKTGQEFIAYLFAEDTPGVIKCGSYNGPLPGNVQPVTVPLGFKPQWVMIKDASTTGDFSNWIIIDDKRKTDTQSNSLGANSGESESYPQLQGIQNLVEFTEDGMIIDPGANGFTNVNGPTSPVNKYIYVAIAAPPAARSQTAEEFAETRLKLLSYKNRKEVACGETATAQRDDLIATLVAQGYSLDEVLEFL